MNRKFKSFLSMFMSAAIAVSSIPLTASAETEYQELSVDNAEVITIDADAVDYTPDDALTVVITEPDEEASPALDEAFLELHYGDNAAVNGSCGDSATWSVSGTTLTVSGSGDMIDFASNSAAMGSEWWAEYSSTITKIVISENITSIGDYAFYYFENLTEISLPSTLTEIGAHAFDSCSSLVTVNNKATKLEKIGDSAFSSCSKFEGIEIPETVTYIGASAFNGVKGITEVTIPAAVGSSFGANAFYGCTSLQVVTIEDGVTAIPEGAFGGCEKLEELTLPDSVAMIGGHAFNGCAALSNINGDTSLFTVPATVIYIGEAAFAGCKSIKSLIIEGNVILGTSAFASCEGLTAINIKGDTPKGGEATETIIWPAAFSGCSTLKAATLDANVTAIGINAFMDTPLETITLPSTLVSIDFGAFCNTRLTAITIPDSVTSIGGFNTAIFTDFEYEDKTYGTFAGCDLLETVTIKNSAARTGTVTIDQWAFQHCTSLKNLDISGTGVIGLESFEGCTALEKVTLPKELFASTKSNVKDTNDFKSQFLDCTALSDVIIEEGAGALGQQMFDGCTSLKSIVVPSSVTANTKAFYNQPSITSAEIYCPIIGQSMFEGAAALAKVTLGGDAEDKGAVETIDKKAFMSCSSIVNITIPETVSAMNDQAFDSCTALKSIVVPDAVTTLAVKLFNGCTSLAAVKYGPELTKIGNYAFCDCTALKGVTYDASAEIKNDGVYIDGKLVNGVTMPSTVTSIGTDAFNSCGGLGFVEISENVTSIGARAFAFCTGLTEMSVPDGVTTISASVFQDCSKLEKVVLAGDVTTIGSKAFMNCVKLDDFVFPDTVTKIDTEAFSGCAVLNSAIPMGVKTINGKAFLGCSALDVALPTAVTSMGTYVFQDCISLGKTAKIILPAGITKVSDGTFMGCKSLPVVVIHDSIKTIGSYAFSGCTAAGFNKLSIPSSVTSVGANAFDGCTSLATVSFAVSGCTKLNSSAFANCTALTDISLPTTGLEEIGANAFENCEKLTTITIPSTVETVGAAAFKDCTTLNKVTLTTNAAFKTLNDKMFMNCTSLQNIEIPDSVTKIGASAFEACKALESVTITGSITILGSRAFYDCDALTYVVIPRSVTTFGSSTFAECSNLETVIILSTKAPGTTSKFMYNCKKATIYCYEDATGVINYAKKDGIKYQATLAGTEDIFVVILKQLENITGAEVGKSYTFAAKVASEGILSYEWFIKNPGETEFKTTGVTTDKYTVNLTAANDGVQVMYKVKVTSPDDANITAETESAAAIVSTFGIPAAKADSVLDSEVTISWNAVNGAAKYNVYRSATPAGEKTLLAEVTDALSYTDTTVEPKTTYYYFVTAYSADLELESNYSAVVKVTTPAVLTTATVTAVAGDGKVVLNWNAIKNATKYRIRRNDGTGWVNYADVTTNTYTDKGVTNGKTYIYAVYAYINGSWADSSNTVTATPEVPVVKNVVATPGDGQIELSWSAIAGATKYRVRRNDGTGWVNYNELAASSFVDTAVVNGTAYRYAIYAYIDGVWCAGSAVVSATPVSSITVVENFNVVAGDGVVTLAWDKIPSATKYRIRRNDGKTWTSLADITTNSYTDKAVTNGTTYKYVVYAFVNGGWGDASEIISATPAVVETVAKNVKAVAGDGVITITWDKASGATKYRIRRNDGTKWTTLIDLAANSYTDKSVTNGTTYKYAVYVYANGAWGEASAIVSATPGKVETVAKNVKAVAGDGKVTITWDNATGATNYRIRRNDGTKWTNLIDLTTNSYTDKSVTNGKTYKYAVYVYANGAWGEASAIVSATPAGAASVAENVKAAVGDESVTLTWNAVAGASEYRIRRNDGTGWKNFADIASTSYTDTAVTNGTTYRYAVYVYANGAWGAASAIVSAVPCATVATNVETSVSAGKVILTWEADGATKFRVRRNDGTGWKTLVDVASTSYTDASVTGGTTYKYAVYVYVNGAWGAASDIVSAKP